MNQFVTREGGQGVYGPASVWQDIQGDGQFQQLTANINNGPSPYTDAYGGTRAGFSATTEINRNDWGVSYNGPIPGGGVAVSEKVTITLEIEGVLDKPE